MHYQSFGWSLMKWCSNVSLNLETVVLHEFNCPYGEVVELLRQCPNLKHLHCRFSDPGKKLLITYTIVFIDCFHHLTIGVF